MEKTVNRKLSKSNQLNHELNKSWTCVLNSYLFSFKKITISDVLSNGMQDAVKLKLNISALYLFVMVESFYLFAMKNMLSFYVQQDLII